MDGRLKQSLYLQWKIARWPLVPFVLAAFSLPLASMTQATTAARSSAYDGIFIQQAWAPLFPATAALLGVTIALVAWAWDHRANHVYALSLPISRTRYTLQKLAAGAAILLIPVAAAWLGALLGAALNDAPPGLREYPNAFALRFLLAALIVYATTFALAAGTMRTAIYVLTAFVLFVVVGSALVAIVAQLTGADLWTPIELLHAALADWPGPFHVFGGNWMLIDV